MWVVTRCHFGLAPAQQHRGKRSPMPDKTAQRMQEIPITQLSSATRPADGEASVPFAASASDLPTPIALSVIIPCYNEVDAIEDTVRALDALLIANFDGNEFEILVVDDGSTDGSGPIITAVAAELPRVRLLRHEHNMGYGASLKTGVRKARGRRIAITDADGTYPHNRLPELIRTEGDMVVGARVGPGVIYSKLRKVPKIFLRRYAQWVTGCEIPDINSGMRVFDRDLALRHLHILPSGFSFTTTITMAAMMEDNDVRYVPISYAPRIGSSKIAPIKDTLRFVSLIVRTGMYFAPLRILSPLIQTAWLLLMGSAMYDVLHHNFTDLTVSLLTIALNLSVLALVADMTRRRTER